MKTLRLFLASLICFLPIIAFGDTAATIKTGGSFSITVISDGTAPFTYQWFKNGVAIPGATSNAYAVAAAQASDAATYTCSVTNPTGSVISDNGVITVTPPVVVPPPVLPPTKATLGIVAKPSTP